MKHLSFIVDIIDEFKKIAIDTDWWRKLTPEEQKLYISEHRKTKLRPTAPRRPAGSGSMVDIYKNIPKSWAKSLSYEGVGENSITSLLSDKPIAKVFRDAMKPSDSVAIIGYSKDGSKFKITKSYDKNKFKTDFIDKNNNEILINEPVHRYSSRRGGYTTYKNELRMGNLVDKIPDKQYKICVVKTDDKLMKQRQIRSDLKPGHIKRNVEGKILAKALKPVYDYHTDIIRNNLNKLEKYSVPDYDNLVNEGLQDIKSVINNIENSRQKLSRIKHAVTDYYAKLPPADVPYKDRMYAIKRFVKHINDTKEKFKNDINKAKSERLYTAMNLVKDRKIVDAIDILQSIGEKIPTELINAVKEKKISKQNINIVDKELYKRFKELY